MSVRMKLVIGLAIGTTIVSLLILPFSLLFVPNPVAVKVPNMSSGKVGAYIGTEQGLYKLYPYASKQTRFPQGSPEVAGRPHVYVKYRQLDVLSAYGIYTCPDDRQVLVAKKTETDRALKLMPKESLRPGLYYITAARDGMYGGQDYFYFKVGLEKEKNN